MRRAIDLHGVALVAEPAEQRLDESLVAEEVPPFGVVRLMTAREAGSTVRRHRAAR